MSLYSPRDVIRVVVVPYPGSFFCRLWDARTSEKLHKDRFRHDLGRVEEGYQEVARRLGIELGAGPGDFAAPKMMQ